MTKGRVYVTVGNKDLISIHYYDAQGKRVKTIDLKHSHNGLKPHTHHGYEHNEKDGKKGMAKLTTEERAMVDRVNRLWYNHKSKQ